MFAYYVFYQHEKGYGCMEIARPKEVEDYDDVMSLAVTIENLSKARNVCVSNYILMKRPTESLKEKLIATDKWVY